MADIKILSPGMFTTIQDSGRYGYQKWGVPVSGCMDPFAYHTANILAGNNEGCAVLEATAAGPSLEFGDRCAIAVTGADMGPAIDGHVIPMWRTLVINKGSVLSFSKLISGLRTYISFGGGIESPVVMGSRSTYTKAALGGFEGRQLKAGDIFSTGQWIAPAIRAVPEADIPRYGHDITVRIILGPQDDYFSSGGMNTFLNSAYTVGKDCDRMGYRLEGEKIAHDKGSNIISDGIQMGSIQIPGSGLPIILMADRQTAGGYPKIATVISSDLPLIAQAKPGDSIRFKKAGIEEGRQIYLETRAVYDRIRNNVLYGGSAGAGDAEQYIVRIGEQKYNVLVEKAFK